ncbi:MAG TPA: PcfJ domain-containing protein [Verrucomicrobiota bacterium]|nr:hypothetical protein [Verrucomicrobiales bacterium]HRI14597.1 PcfJ domain-containing protein [Verrucomicrobiota bacterium]
MNYCEMGLSGTQIRHASRKRRRRFERSWSVSAHARLTQEEAITSVYLDEGEPPRYLDDDDFEAPRSWWLIIADRAGRNHFGCPPRPTTQPSQSGLNGEETAGEPERQPATQQDLLQFLAESRIWYRSWPDSRTCNRAVKELGRHPFFQAPPPIGFDSPAADMLEYIVAYRDFWLRDAAVWNAPQDDAATCIADLFAHLFCRYDLPVWLKLRLNPTAADKWDPNWVRLALYVGRGGSLYEIGSRMFLDEKGQTVFTRQGIQHLGDAPRCLDVQESVYYALVLQSGGDEAAAWDFYNCRLRYNHPRPSRCFDAPAVRTVAPWLTKNRFHLCPGLGPLVVVWAFCEMKRRETDAWMTRSTMCPLSLKKRSVRSVLTSVFRSLSCSDHPLQDAFEHLLNWPSQGWDRTLILDDTAWTFREICTLADLARESKEMNHCVFQYLDRCAAGETIIVSLASEHGDRVTLEICPLTHILLQIRGHTNRDPSLAEQAAVQEWMRSIHDGYQRKQPA